MGRAVERVDPKGRARAESSDAEVDLASVGDQTRADMLVVGATRLRGDVDEHAGAVVGELDQVRVVGFEIDVLDRHRPDSALVVDRELAADVEAVAVGRDRARPEALPHDRAVAAVELGDPGVTVLVGDALKARDHQAALGREGQAIGAVLRARDAARVGLRPQLVALGIEAAQPGIGAVIVGADRAAQVHPALRVDDHGAGQLVAAEVEKIGPEQLASAGPAAEPEIVGDRRDLRVVGRRDHDVAIGCDRHVDHDRDHVGHRDAQTAFEGQPARQPTQAVTAVAVEGVGVVAVLAGLEVAVATLGRGRLEDRRGLAALGLVVAGRVARAGGQPRHERERSQVDRVGSPHSLRMARTRVQGQRESAGRLVCVHVDERRVSCARVIGFTNEFFSTSSLVHALVHALARASNPGIGAVPVLRRRSERVVVEAQRRTSEVLGPRSQSHLRS